MFTASNTEECSNTNTTNQDVARKRSLGELANGSELTNSKETRGPAMTEKIVASELAKNDTTTNTGSPEGSSPLADGENEKVELRMDEITSKFKNAFERMAELESLQLSMENDADEDMKAKWSQSQHLFCKPYKSPLKQDTRLLADQEIHRSNGNNVVVTAKEERLSPIPGITPVQMNRSDTENEFETHDGVSENTLPSEWSYEEQFKKLYELGDEPDRKEFLDKLFAFMQQRGTPVNRVPIMAKQTLDLYQLYKLVVERGGLVEVINKKIWRGIIKGLNLPSSVTSAAFTLRTQYMKYIYPYECSTLKLSSPNELQSAIDGNRRDTTRRPSIGHYTSMVEPEVGFYSDSTSPKSNCSSPTLKRASSPTMIQSMSMRVPGQNEFISPSFHGNNGIGFNPTIQRVIAPSDNRTFKYDVHRKSPNYGHLERSSYEPPRKRSPNHEECDKRITYSQIPWANIKIRTPSRVASEMHENGEEMTSKNGEEMPSNNGEENHSSIYSGKSPKQPPVTSFDQINENSMVVSIELNGVRYQGVLYAQRR